MNLDHDAAQIITRVLHALDGSIPISTVHLTADISYLHAVACQTTGVYAPLNVRSITQKVTP